MPPHVRARPGLRRGHAYPSPAREIVTIEVRLLRRRLDCSRWRRVSAFALGGTLEFDLGPDGLFHPLQTGSVDDQRAEPAGRNFTPSGENDLHVIVGCVAVPGRTPRS